MPRVSITGIIEQSPAQRRALLDGLLPTNISWLAAPGGAAVRDAPRPPRLVAQLLQLAALNKPDLF